MFDPNNPTPELNISLRRTTISAIVFVFLLALSLFLPAGFDWGLGWIFLAVFSMQMAIATWFLTYKNPEVVIARSKFDSGVKSWDKIMAALIIVSFGLTFPVAGFDHRLHWSGASSYMVVAAYIVFMIGMVGSVWVLSVNKFAEPGVRVQTERGHSVIDSGPYAHVRHPLYTATFLTLPGFALMLGSYVALVPVAISLALLVVRTRFEDRMLQEELAGYKEYAQRVRYRLLPGVW